jgi:thioester reductase-like protein
MSAPNVDTICPLSPLQHGMLHAARRDPASGLYVEQFSCTIVGALDVDGFRAAWQAVVMRHDVLRTLFLRLDTEKPVQVVRKAVTLPFVVDDWGTPSGGGDEATRFAALLAEDRRAGFDPSVAPLMRVRLVRTAPDRHRFLWTYHHAILDGWSMPILLREVFEHLAAPGRALPPPRGDYRHYLAWLAKQDLAPSLAFWRGRLGDFRTPMRFAPVVAPDDGDPTAPRRLATRQALLPPAWTDAATARCRATRITLNTLCQAAWALTLAHYGDVDDVVHGLVVSGRTADVPGIERMAGLFIGTLPIRATLDRDAPAGDWLRRLQADAQAIERHAATPLARVLSCADVPRSQALFDTLYVFENYPGQSAFHALVEAHGLRVEDVRAVEETGYGLALIVLPVDGLQLQLTYDTAKFTPAAIDELLASYRHLLDRLLAIGDGALGTVFAGIGGIPDRKLAVAPTPMTSCPEASPAEDATIVLPEGLRLGPTELHAAIARARDAWCRLGLQAGDRVLLLPGDDPFTALTALLSGLSHGLDLVLPARRTTVEEARADAADTLGASAPSHAVAATDVSGSFDAPAVPHGLELPAMSGTVTWLARAPDGEAVAVRQGAAALVARTTRTTRTPAPLAMAGALTDAPVLAALLRTLHHGGTLEIGPAPATPRDLAAWLHTLADREGIEICLDVAQTRALAEAAALTTPARPGDARCAGRVAVTVDAAALTPAGTTALEHFFPRATIHRVLVDPSTATPIAHVGPDGRLFHASGSATPCIVDAGGEPVAVHARGRLALRDEGHDATLWRRGRIDRTQRLVTRDGVLRLTGHAAWHRDQSIAIRLPDPRAALHGDRTMLDALERALAEDEGARAVAAGSRLDDTGEWRTTIHVVPVAASRVDALLDRLRGAAGVLGFGNIDVAPVASLPVDARDRTDRVALWRGDVPPLANDAESALPRDATESTLHGIWCTLLQRARIGRDEDYFDLGGDSLLATVMLAKVQAATGITLEIDAFLQHPTIAGLARTLRGDGPTREDLAAQLACDAAAPLDLPLDTGSTTPSAPIEGPISPRDVFLTGATGFLGVHLLAELLATTGARVHCLVRAADAAAGHARLVRTLQDHALWNPAHADRLVAVPGDLGPARFGLSTETFEALAHRVDLVIHNGASVNFVLPYAKLKAANVDATDEVLRLAATGAPKPVHYVSTVGVLDRAADTLPETLAVPLHARLLGGYEQSKWVAEQRVRVAGERGLPVTIHRPSRIVGHSRTGRMNADDLFGRLIRGAVLQGQAAYGTGYDNMLPVDVVARVIVEAARDPAAAGCAVHVVHPRSHAFDALIDAIASRGHPIERLPYPAWLAAVDASAKVRDDHPLAPLLPVLRALDPTRDATLSRAMPLGHENLQRLAPRAFASLASTAPETLFIPMFEHLESMGLLPRPSIEGTREATRSPIGVETMA